MLLAGDAGRVAHEPETVEPCAESVDPLGVRVDGREHREHFVQFLLDAVEALVDTRLTVHFFLFFGVRFFPWESCAFGLVPNRLFLSRARRSHGTEKLVGNERERRGGLVAHVDLRLGDRSKLVDALAAEAWL